jgi:hypothetical protein
VALAEVLADGAIRAGQQARGADALVTEQVPALAVASLLVRTTTSDRAERGRLLHLPGGTPVDAPRRGRRVAGAANSAKRSSSGCGGM